MFDQALFLLLGGAAIEVVAAEVLVHRSILEHVEDGGQHGGGDGHDRLLGVTPGFDTMKLGLEVGSCLSFLLPPKRTEQAWS
jgi:hypothetical protein